MKLDYSTLLAVGIGVATLLWLLRKRAAVTGRKAFAERGYAVLRAAVTPATMAAIRRECEEVRHKLSHGGYHIWAIEQLPPAMRAWSEGEGAALLEQVIGNGSAVECTGAAALFKIPPEQGGATPWHQDDAYQHMSSGESTKNRAGTVWLALTAADAHSACLRFLPSPLVGTQLRKHHKVAREGAKNGFKVFLVPGGEDEAEAERHAVDEPVAAGDVVLLGGTVVHCSHAALDAERIAFSPIYTWASASRWQHIKRYVHSMRLQAIETEESDAHRG